MSKHPVRILALALPTALAMLGGVALGGLTFGLALGVLGLGVGCLGGIDPPDRVSH